MLCKRELSSLVCYLVLLLVGGKQGAELFCSKLITPPTAATGTAYERIMNAQTARSQHVWLAAVQTSTHRWRMTLKTLRIGTKADKLDALYCRNVTECFTLKFP